MGAIDACAITDRQPTMYPWIRTVGIAAALVMRRAPNARDGKPRLHEGLSVARGGVSYHTVCPSPGDSHPVEPWCTGYGMCEKYRHHHEFFGMRPL